MIRMNVEINSRKVIYIDGEEDEGMEFKRGENEKKKEKEGIVDEIEIEKKGKIKEMVYGKDDENVKIVEYD